MRSMANYGGDLAIRLYSRYHGAYDNVAALDDLMCNDAVVALIQFLFIGIKRGDLQPDEVTEGLILAKERKLLKSSKWLESALAEYQRAHTAA